ncbi:hypothetical protein [Campylobacter concisus]|uniref:hypothetical protein n=1 Tax=Campylobacter concisus TaxID=199 RepID=UPI001CA5B723|nr:hypothetical protein [Campylobacter concisus]
MKTFYNDQAKPLLKNKKRASKFKAKANFKRGLYLKTARDIFKSCHKKKAEI